MPPHICLEVEFRGQLNRSAGVEGAGNLSEVGRSHRLSRESKVGMVEEVEEFATQFELVVFAIDVPHLAKREVVIDKAAGLQGRWVAQHVAPRSVSRNNECSRIEPLRW